VAEGIDNIVFIASHPAHNKQNSLWMLSKGSCLAQFRTPIDSRCACFYVLVLHIWQATMVEMAHR